MNNVMGNQQACAGARREERRRRRMFFQGVVFLILSASLIAGVFGIRVMHDIDHGREVNRIALAAESKTRGERLAMLREARAYNRALAASGQPVIGGVDSGADGASGTGVDTTDTTAAPHSRLTYHDMLSLAGGAMGSISIQRIGINLPIYHGTDEQTLIRGAGHLYGTSLPIGGRSTHAVITAHRGLVSDELFTHLDEMKTGDEFVIHALDGNLHYRVDSIAVINPDAVSKLLIRPGEDRVTLMTCTPYGINTQRLLVSGIRVHDASERSADTLGERGALVGFGVFTAIGAVGITCVAVRMRGCRVCENAPMGHGRR